MKTNSALQLCLLACSLFCSTTTVSAQGSFEYWQLSRKIERASNSAVYVTVGGTGKAGTGFMMFVPFGPTPSGKADAGRTILVTNKHLMERRDRNDVIIGLSTQAKVLLPLVDGGMDTATCTLLERWTDRDLAILLPDPPLGNIDKYGFLPVYPEDLAEYNEIHKGQAAYVAGFPLGLGVTSTNLNAVTQGGIVAHMDPTKDLMLLDIPINPGSSGSPAFVITDSLKWKVLGVAYAYEPTRDYTLRLLPKSDSTRTSEVALDTVRIIGRHGTAYQVVHANSSLSRIVLIGNLLEAWRQAIIWTTK